MKVSFHMDINNILFRGVLMWVFLIISVHVEKLLLIIYKN